MTILARAFASGGSDVIIPTIELYSSAWPSPILLCNGYENHTCGTEDGRTVTFIASGIEVALPKKDTTGTQVLAFAIDNVIGDAQEFIDAVLDSGAMAFLTFRHYLASDKSAPAVPPMKFVVRDGTISGTTLQINAAFFDTLGTAWPRRYYTSSFAPGLRYFS